MTALERDLDGSVAAARETRSRIAPFVRHTPLLELDADAAGVVRMLKLETLQRTGSFKLRGAASALTAAAAPRRVLAASTGNHGAAVATVARALGLPCRVFVPESASAAKVAKLRATGARLVTIPGDPLLAELAAREAAAAEPGTLLVPPYNDERVVLGQATLGLELLEDCGEPPDALFAAVGGGGLIGGIALAVRSRWPRCRIVGCLPAASPALAAAAGAAVADASRPTLSDATAGAIEEGSITVAICAALVDEFVLVEEAEIAAAMRAALLEHALVIEGAAAVALAVSRRESAGGARHLVVLSGGNVAASTLASVL